MRKLDMSKFKFSDKLISMEDALKDTKPWINSDDIDKEERSSTVLESLEQSLKEMQLMREGKLPKKTFKEVSMN